MIDFWKFLVPLKFMKTSKAALKERATLMLRGPEEQSLPVVTSTQPGPDLGSHTVGRHGMSPLSLYSGCH